MGSPRYLLLLLFVGLTVFALAAEKPASSQTTNSQTSSTSTPQSPDTGTVTTPYAVIQQWAAKQTPNSSRNYVDWSAMRKRGGRSLADLNGGVCFTMRMYKIKPTERLADGESANRGYSECQMASDYQIRSADAHENGPAKTK